MTAPQKRVFINLPKKHMQALAENYELQHGLIVKNLIAYLNEGYIRAYFEEWGTVTLCKIIKAGGRNAKAMAFVRFSTEDEADRADWAGPHEIGGYDVQVTRVVSPRMASDDEEEEAQKKADSKPARPRARRSMGLGYILEDAQWLDDDMEEE